ncbi:MAG: tetratricopeptide repeat protein [Thermoanaerobaculaceae bacterium]|nr:tetratricopeptide repeat protein [Thermoanaerobaculaceae bacterium]
MNAAAAPEPRGRGHTLGRWLASRLVRGALLGLAAVAAYGACLEAGVAWDDGPLLASNPEVRSLGQPLRFFTDPTTGGPSSWPSRHLYRPLRTVAYALEWTVFPGAAWGFHLTSLLLHGAGAVAVGWLTALLFGRGRWVAATVWLLHPALSENVLYLAAQSNLLCLLCCVLAVGWHVTWLRTGRRTARAGSLLAAGAAMLSYEFGAVIPLLLVLTESVLQKRGERLPSSWLRRHFPHWLVLGAYLLLRTAVVEPFPGLEWWGGSWSASVLLQLRLWVEGWRLTLLPSGQLPRYDAESIPPWITPAVAFTVHLVAVGVAMLAYRRQVAPWIGPAVLWWYASQLPTANLLWPNAGYPFAPRFLFLALVLPVAGVASALAAAAERRPLLWVAAAGVLVLFIALDRQQAEVWHSGRTLFAHMVARNPEDVLARFNLAVLLYRGGQLRAAAEELQVVSRWPSLRGPAAYLLGEILRSKGRVAEARRRYLEALRSVPSHPGAHLRLAELCLLEGDVAGARRWVEPLTYLEEPPPLLHAEIELALARIAAAGGACREARERTEAATKGGDLPSSTLFAAGRVLASCGDREGGRALRRRAAETAWQESRLWLGEGAW